MLKFIAPFGLASFLAKVISLFPTVLSPIVFGVIVFLYLRILGAPLADVLGRLDFIIATAWRKIGLSPPGVQHAIAEAIPRLPRLFRRIGAAVLLLGIVTQVAVIVTEEPGGAPALLFQVFAVVDGTDTVRPFSQNDFFDWLEALESEDM
jgi:hypothetical protein